MLQRFSFHEIYFLTSKFYRVFVFQIVTSLFLGYEDGQNMWPKYIDFHKYIWIYFEKILEIYYYNMLVTTEAYVVATNKAMADIIVNLLD